MRIVSTLTAALFAASLMTLGATHEVEAKPGPKKSHFGCVVGKEKWDAGSGKCVAAKPVKKAAKKADKKPEKKAEKKPVKKAAKKKA
jgi:hypothetical protein